jgi:hypothetical protein
VSLLNDLSQHLLTICRWLLYPLDPAAFPLFTAIGLGAIVAVVCGIVLGEKDRRRRARIAKRIAQNSRTKTEKPPPQMP